MIYIFAIINMFLIFFVYKRIVLSLKIFVRLFPFSFFLREEGSEGFGRGRERRRGSETILNRLQAQWGGRSTAGLSSQP